MTPIFMQRPGDQGDCLRACVASIMDLPADIVPEFEGSNAYLQFLAVKTFLRGFGYTFVSVDYAVPDDDPSPNSVMRAFGAANDDLYYIMTGRNAKGVGHAIVCYGMEVVHDPAGRLEQLPQPGIVQPFDRGLYGVHTITLKGGNAPMAKRSRISRVRSTKA